MQRSVQAGPSDLDPRLVGELVRPVHAVTLRPDLRPWPDPGDGAEVFPPPFIVTSAPGWERYDSLRTRRLAQDFRVLADGLSAAADDGSDPLVRFINRYGFIGRPQILRDSQGAWVGYGEALESCRRSLGRFKAIADTWDAVAAAGNGAELTRRRLEQLVPAEPDGRRRIDLGELACAWLQPTELKGRPLRAVVADRLRALVTETIDTHIHVALAPGQPIRFRPDCVLAAAYLDLATEMVGQAGARVRECDYCHNPYRASRRDSRFCSATCRSQARHKRDEEGS